jgi:hypothetical protein
MGGGCDLNSRYSVLSNFTGIVVHLFNFHVCCRADWTIERLADWLRTVEPIPVEETSITQEPVAIAA